MKKLFLFAAVLMVTGSFMSCTKDYTCECTFTNGMDAVTLPFENQKKADAEDACTAAETTYKIADPDVTCKLK